MWEVESTRVPGGPGLVPPSLQKRHQRCSMEQGGRATLTVEGTGDEHPLSYGVKPFPYLLS